MYEQVKNLNGIKTSKKKGYHLLNNRRKTTLNLGGNVFQLKHNEPAYQEELQEAAQQQQLQVISQQLQTILNNDDLQPLARQQQLQGINANLNQLPLQNQEVQTLRNVVNQALQQLQQQLQQQLYQQYIN